MVRILRSVPIVVFVCGVAAASSAQEMRFDDVVRNLRNPDAKVRLSAIHLLKDAKYPEAITPMAALVNDPVDQIQLEAIGAELSFFLVEDVPAKKRVGLLLEVRNAGRAAAAFEQGPLAVWPRPAPSELVSALLQAVDDANQKVRLEAIYALGVIARPPLAADAATQVLKALDHYDPLIRAGAAAVVGRLALANAGGALMKAVNDSNASVRFAAMRALGETHDTSAITALTEQFNYYGRGEGAWSALDALAQIGHASSVPLFKSRIADKDPYLRRAAAEGLGRAGDRSEVAALEIGAGNDSSEMARAAMAFALQKLGRNYVVRLVDFMDSDKMVPQIQGYLLELGPSIVRDLVPRLQEPDATVRARVADVLGALGDDTVVPALQTATQDRDRGAAEAAKRALDRIKLKRG
jgi:HEAT repeat protein